MPNRASRPPRALTFCSLLILVLIAAGAPGAGARGQGGPAAGGPVTDSAYQQLKAFALTGGSSDVSSFVLKRDRVEMTFNGTF